MSFNTINLTGERVLVRGTDITGAAGECTLDATQWNELGQRKAVSQAQDAFDAAVEEFFAPIVAAAEQASAAIERPTDSIGYVVLEEAVEGQPSKPGHLVKLTRDSIVLRLIESGNTDRLIWVNGELEVTEAAVQQASSTPAPAETVEPEAQVGDSQG